MSSDGFELGNFLPYRLAVLSERVSKRLSAIYEERFGLSVAEWRVLVHLSRCGDISVREIHRCVNLEKSRVSRAVARLEARRLVAKRESGADRRLLAIALTAEGRTLLAELLPLALAFERDFLSALGAEECSGFLDAIEVLQRRLDTDPAAPARPERDKDGA